MRVVGYIRVSTEEQAELGHSLDAQETLICQFAGSRGWQVVEIYRDAGISGRLDQRPALTRMLQDAEQGLFEAVIVHAIDRLYRNLEAMLKALQHLRVNNIAFVSITENMDFTTPWGKLTLAVLGTLAEIYIDKLSAETSKGKQQRARKGLWNGSIPLGYCTGQCAVCTDPNGDGYCPYFGGPNLNTGESPLIPHPIESKAVQLAFEWHSTGQFSDGQIAEKLNRYQYHHSDDNVYQLRTKRYHARGGPGPFGKDTVREILTRIFYTGVVPYYGVNEKGQKRKRRDPVALYPGQHPALIDQALFDKVQDIREMMSRHPRRRGQTQARVYPLSGILHCNRCRARMRAQGGSRGKQYYCCSTRLQHTAACSQAMVQAHRLEEQLHLLLQQINIPADWQRAVLVQLGRDPDLLAQQETQIRARLEKATDLYLDGVISQERFETERRSSEFQLADLRVKDLDDIIAAENQLNRLKKFWHDLPDIEIKKSLKKLFSAVFVQKNRIVAVQVTERLFPLMKLTLETGARQLNKAQSAPSFGTLCFYYGSDGT